MIFKTFAIYLLCLGQLIWPECKQSCDGINWLDQSEDEVEAFGVTAAPLDAIDETEAPATTAFVANADPGMFAKFSLKFFSNACFFNCDLFAILPETSAQGRDPYRK